MAKFRYEKDRKLSMKHHKDSIKRDKEHAKDHLKSAKEHEKVLSKLGKAKGHGMGKVTQREYPAPRRKHRVHAR